MEKKHTATIDRSDPPFTTHTHTHTPQYYDFDGRDDSYLEDEGASSFCSVGGFFVFTLRSPRDLRPLRHRRRQYLSIYLPCAPHACMLSICRSARTHACLSIYLSCAPHLWCLMHAYRSIVHPQARPPFFSSSLTTIQHTSFLFFFKSVVVQKRTWRTWPSRSSTLSTRARRTPS